MRIKSKSQFTAVFIYFCTMQILDLILTTWFSTFSFNGANKKTPSERAVYEVLRDTKRPSISFSVHCPLSFQYIIVVRGESLNVQKTHDNPLRMVFDTKPSKSVEMSEYFCDFCPWLGNMKRELSFSVSDAILGQSKEQGKDCPHQR